jgi:hypothetical protein
MVIKIKKRDVILINLINSNLFYYIILLFFVPGFAVDLMCVYVVSDNTRVSRFKIVNC